MGLCIGSGSDWGSVLSIIDTSRNNDCCGCSIAGLNLEHRSTFVAINARRSLPGSGVTTCCTVAGVFVVRRYRASPTQLASDFRGIFAAGPGGRLTKFGFLCVSPVGWVLHKESEQKLFWILLFSVTSLVGSFCLVCWLCNLRSPGRRLRCPGDGSLAPGPF